MINKNSKRKLPPSPPSLPVLGHLQLLKTPLHQALVGISNRPALVISSPTFGFGSRPALVISSPTLAEQCFTTHNVAFSNRPQLPFVILPNAIAIVKYEPYCVPCGIYRFAVVELLSNQRLQASSDIRAREVQDMARQLFQSYNQTEKLENSSRFEKLQLKDFLF